MCVGGGAWAWSRTRRGPGLWVFDNEGISFPIWRLPPIRWADVVGFRLTSNLGIRNLIIDVADQSGYGRRLRGYQAWTVRRTLKRYRGVAYLPLVGLDLGADEIVRLANARRARVVPDAAPLEIAANRRGTTREIWPLLFGAACALQMIQLVSAAGRASSAWRASLLTACVAGLLVGVLPFWSRHRQAAFWVIASTEIVLVVATLLFGHGDIGRRITIVFWPWVVLSALVWSSPEILRSRPVRAPR
jgi:hypothetical protein